MGAFRLLVIFLATTGTVAQYATTCMHNQVRRKGAPSVAIISQSLHELLSTPQFGPCSGAFDVLQNGTLSNNKTWFTGGLAIEVTRETSTVRLGEECLHALTSIIHTCVEDGKYWGGNATSSGAKYAIYNSIFPKNWTPTSAVTPSQKRPSQLAASVKQHSKPGTSRRTSTRASRGASKQGASDSSTHLPLQGRISNHKTTSSNHHGNPHHTGSAVHPISNSHHMIPHKVPTHAHAAAAKAPAKVHHAISSKTPTHGVSGKKPTKVSTGKHHPILSKPAKAAPGNAKQQSIYAADASIMKNGPPTTLDAAQAQESKDLAAQAAAGDARQSYYESLYHKTPKTTPTSRRNISPVNITTPIVPIPTGRFLFFTPGTPIDPSLAAAEAQISSDYQVASSAAAARASAIAAVNCRDGTWDLTASNYNKFQSDRNLRAFWFGGSDTDGNSFEQNLSKMNLSLSQTLAMKVEPPGFSLVCTAGTACLTAPDCTSKLQILFDSSTYL